MLEIKATLRVFSKEIIFSDLIKILGKPTHGYSKGDEYSKGKKCRDLSFWALESSSCSGSNFKTHIKEVLNFIDSKANELDRIKNKCEIDIFCMISSDNGQGGVVLSSELIKSLSYYNINVVLDLYMDLEED